MQRYRPNISHKKYYDNFYARHRPESKRKKRAFSVKRQVVWFLQRSAFQTGNAHADSARGNGKRGGGRGGAGYRGIPQGKNCWKFQGYHVLTALAKPRFLEYFTFEKGETRDGGTAPPEKGKTFQHPKKNDARRFP